MRAIALQSALYKLWELWSTVLYISLGRYGRYPPLTDMLLEVAMTCSTLEVCQGRQRAKIKIHIVLGLGCERLI